MKLKKMMDLQDVEIAVTTAQQVMQQAQQKRAVMQERQTHLIFPEISQYYPVRMVPVQEVLSSSCLELKRKMKQVRKRT